MTSYQESTLRNRSRVGNELSKTYKEIYPGSTSTYGPYITDSDEESMVDYVTPNYKRLVSQGVIINNPALYVRGTISSVGNGSGSFNNASGTYPFTVEGAISRHLHAAIGGFPSTGWTEIGAISLVSNVERAKALALSYIDSTPYAFGEDSLELMETLRFLRNPLHSLANLGKSFQRDIRKAKRIRVKGRNSDGSLNRYAKRIVAGTRNDINYKKSLLEQTKAIADVWLTYQFAASPLVRSIDDAISAYTVKEPPIRAPRRSARGKSEDEEKAQGTVVHYAGSGTYRTWELSHYKSEDIKASILYTVSNPIEDLTWRLGFRKKDWPTTVWQIMPLSFMVDRVFDVTTFSKGVMNLLDPKVEILSACVRYKRKEEYTYRLKSVSNASWPGTASGEKVTETHFEYQRDPWTPSVRDTFPTLSVGRLVDTATKLADLAALIRARFTV
jgi:hypothetical protein